MRMLKFLIAILMCNGGFINFMDDGGTPPPADDGGTPPPAGDPGEGGIKANYPEGLDSSYHGNPTLLKYLDKESGDFKMGEVMKGLIHASSQLGRDKMVIPNENFTEDQWKETYQKLGVPSELDKYELQNNVKDGLMKSDEMFDGFKKAAFDANVAPKQAQKLLDFYNDQIGKLESDTMAASKQAITDSVDGLKKDWGNAYDRNMKLADNALQEFASDEEISVIKESGILNDANIAKLFSKIGKSLFEEGTAGEGGVPPGDMDSTELEGKIKAMYAEGSAYMNSRHPQHEAAMQQMARLMKLKTGMKK